MDVESHAHQISYDNSGKNFNLQCNIPILEIPLNEDILIIFMFKEEINSIELYLLDENSSILLKYHINNYPDKKV